MDAGRIARTIRAGALLLAGCGAGASELRHSVAAGETLSGICARLTRERDCVVQLQDRHGIRDARQLQPGTVLGIPAQWLAEVPIVGGVLESTGEASYRAIGGGEFAPLVPGEPVYLGDTIRTGDGTALLEFISGLMILLRADSTLVLDMLSDAETGPLVELALEHGSMEAATTSSTETAQAQPDAGHPVRAGSTIASIDGAARLNAAPDGGAVSGEALRGDLELAAGGTVVDVPEGHGWSTGTQGDATTPSALLPAPELLPSPGTGTAAPAKDSSDPGVVALASFRRMFHHTPYRGPRTARPASADELARRVRGLLLDETTPAPGAARWNNVFMPVTLDWGADPDAAGWQIDVLSAPPGTGGPTTLRVGAPAVRLPQLSAGCYVLGLRAIDRRGLAGIERLLPVCVHPPLAAPAPRLAGGTVRRINWDAVADADRYTVELASDAAFERLVRSEDTRALALDLPAIGESTLYVRVRAVNAANMRGPAGAVLRLEGS